MRRCSHFTGAQRETGEVLVEGVGAMELIATESGGLRRMDVREAGAITQIAFAFSVAGGVSLQPSRG